MSKILIESSEIRKEIIKLYSSPTHRRVAITAFVGDGAESYLPKPKGLELICWPKAGGTNPHALDKLIRLGVKISFVDSLHMKLYWAEGIGAIITSANLSTNALGNGNLKEIGIHVEPNKINIDKIISSLDTRDWSPRELQKLYRDHDLYHKNNPPIRTSTKTKTFKQWYESSRQHKWKLGWYENYVYDFSQKAKEIVQRDYKTDEPYNCIPGKKDDYKQYEWILTFLLEKKYRKKNATAFKWLYVDFIVKVDKKDKIAYDSIYPYQAVQIWKLNRYSSPPFIIDTNFSNAFCKAINKYGGNDRIKGLKSITPPNRFIDLIYKYL